jgi:murein DD-endopeptidase MepM/ murein hydrolase activator NlpD
MSRSILSAAVAVGVAAATVVAAGGVGEAASAPSPAVSASAPTAQDASVSGSGGATSDATASSSHPALSTTTTTTSSSTTTTSSTTTKPSTTTTSSFSTTTTSSTTTKPSTTTTSSSSSTTTTQPAPSPETPAATPEVEAPELKAPEVAPAGAPSPGSDQAADQSALSVCPTGSSYEPWSTSLAGLSPAQMQNALTIVQVGASMGAGTWGETVAVATAIQESDLENLTGYDAEGAHGLFGQKAPGYGWGTVAETEDPLHAAQAFYAVLLSIPGWQTLPLTVAAQDVQRSGYPDAYAKWQGLAEELVADLQGSPPGQATQVAPETTTAPGLSTTQLQNAAIIISVGQAMGAGTWGETVAVATAIQESDLEDLMSDSGGGSHGLFSQRAPGFGWGTVAETEDPVHASEKFYLRLLSIPGWQSLPLAVAAQDVQRSAYPDAYAKWQPLAAELVQNAVATSDNTTTLSALGGCPAPVPVDAAGYANPLRGLADLTPERIDQGVDYAGSGPVYAIGPGVVENVYNPGWPAGVFIVYVLTTGPDAGRAVYVAEYLVPEVAIGERVDANTPLGLLGSGGMETGWADLSALGESEAMADHQAATTGDSGAVSTPDGISFDALLVALGAPSGVLQGS